MSNMGRTMNVGGTRLLMARKERRLSQTELGEMVNKSASEISRLESGARTLTYDDIVIFAHVLHKKPAWFFGEEDDPSPVIPEKALSDLAESWAIIRERYNIPA